jgi:hypothetical protein
VLAACIFTSLQGATTQKTAVFIIAAATTATTRTLINKKYQEEFNKQTTAQPDYKK